MIWYLLSVDHGVTWGWWSLLLLQLLPTTLCWLGFCLTKCIRDFLNSMHYINPRFTYLLTIINSTIVVVLLSFCITIHKVTSCIGNCEYTYHTYLYISCSACKSLPPLQKNEPPSGLNTSEAIDPCTSRSWRTRLRHQSESGSNADVTHC